VASRTLPDLAVDEDWKRGDAEILFVGSSHVYSGVRSPAFERPAGVVSFAGMNVALAEAVLRKHRALWPKLGLIVLEVDEFTLLTDTVSGIRDDLGHLCDRLGLSFWDLPRGDSAAWEHAGRAMRGCSWALLGPRHRLSLPRLRARLVGGGALFEPPRPPRSWTESGVALSEQNAKKRTRFLEELVEAAPGAKARNLAALSALASTASRQGLELALISLPKHRYYRQLRPTAWDEAIGAAVHAARRGGARNAEHWNLQADPRFRDAAFEDQDHLNAAGAAALAPLLEDLVAARAPTPAGRFARQNGS
jgi:hypothetical protein